MIHNFADKTKRNLISDLQITTLALDFRVAVLEENGGGEGNSSVAQLEVRVKHLKEQLPIMRPEFLWLKLTLMVFY